MSNEDAFQHFGKTSFYAQIDKQEAQLENYSLLEAHFLQLQENQLQVELLVSHFQVLV